MWCPRSTNSTVLLLLVIVLVAAIVTIELDVRYKLFFRQIFHHLNCTTPAGFLSFAAIRMG